MISADAGAACRVSVIVPCRNERPFVDGFLDAVLAQRLPPQWSMQVLVADGASDDGTRERLQARAAQDARLVLIDNPRRATAAGLNAAIAAAQGDVIVRMDVHTTYAKDYVQRCVEVLAQTGATCVGGAWRVADCPGVQGAIGAAFASRFGSGAAASRRASYTGPVDTVYLGTWRREALHALGGYDENLLRTEDDELNLRILRGGGSVWQSAEIRCWYRPRPSFRGLWAQFYQYGYWKVPLIRKHRLPASPRHLVPTVFLLLLAAFALVGLVWRPAAWAGLVLAGLYAAAAVAAATAAAPPWRGLARWAGVLWAYPCMHFGYGTGFARAMLDAATGRGPGPEALRITR